MSDNEARSGDGKATASLVLGATSLICSCFTGIPAIVLGALALGDASEKAKPRAYIGIGLGLVTTLGGFIYAIVADPPEPVEPKGSVEAAPLPAPKESSGQGKPEGSAAATPTKAEEPAPAPEGPPKPEMAADQAKFCSTVAQYSEEYRDAQRSGANELKLSKLRSNRGKALLKAVPSRSFKNWLGKVDTLSTTSEGKAVMVIDLTCGASVGTWNNALSDVMDNTLIPQSSPLYDAIAELSDGQSLRVSGKFAADKKDGIKEMSMTEMGSMTDPEFVVRFTGLGPP